MLIFMSYVQYELTMAFAVELTVHVSALVQNLLTCYRSARLRTACII
jgi:hypothetical protein